MGMNEKNNHHRQKLYVKGFKRKTFTEKILKRRNFMNPKYFSMRRSVNCLYILPFSPVRHLSITNSFSRECGLFVLGNILMVRSVVVAHLQVEYLSAHLCAGVGVQRRGGGAAPVAARGALRARRQQRVESFALCMEITNFEPSNCLMSS